MTAPIAARVVTSLRGDACDVGVRGGVMANAHVISATACTVKSIFVQLLAALPAGTYYLQLLAPKEDGTVPADGDAADYTARALAEPVIRTTSGVLDQFTIKFEDGRAADKTADAGTHVGPGAVLVLSSTQYSKTLVAGSYMAVDASVRN